MKISEENGNLIMSVAKGTWNKKYKNFPNNKEDAIGFAMLKMCESLNKYDSNKNISLNSYLNLIADRSFKKYFRDFVFKHKDKYVDLSITDDEGYSLDLEDIIGSFDVNYNNIEFRELMNKFDKTVEKRNKRTSRKMNLKELHYIIEMLDKGYNKSEISRILGVSTTTINKKVNRITNIVTEINENN